VLIFGQVAVGLIQLLEQTLVFADTLRMIVHRNILKLGKIRHSVYAKFYQGILGFTKQLFSDQEQVELILIITLVFGLGRVLEPHILMINIVIGFLMFLSQLHPLLKLIRQKIPMNLELTETTCIILLHRLR